VRKRSKNAVRRPRPLKAPSNTYFAGALATPSMADIRAYLDRRRKSKGQHFSFLGAGDHMGAALEKAFSGLGKKPVLTRRQAFVARQTRRASLSAA